MGGKFGCIDGLDGGNAVLVCAGLVHPHGVFDDV